MASPSGANQNPNLNQNPNQYLQPPSPRQQAASNFDIQKLFKAPSGPTFPIPTTPNLTNTSPFPPISSPSSSTSASYPPPAGPSNPFHPHFLPYHQPQNINMQPPSPRPISSQLQSSPNNPNTSGGARLMALLNTQRPSTIDSPQPTIPFPSAPPTPPPANPSAPPLVMTTQQSSPLRLPSRKLPKGRHLIGDHIVYDIDVRLPGEVQPQLEVTPITKYGSDPGLVLGRQIAVNKSYICYGLKPGAIRVLDINTALRALLRGHTQRVTDMAFFAEDVHLLASASVDGRVFIWKISEGTDEEDKPQITGKVIVAIQIVGEGKSIHPRLCWHPHKQEILIVSIGSCIFKIDSTKVCRGKKFSAEEPLLCPIDQLVDGVSLVGKHEGEITELTMCQWMTSRLASASVDGVVKIWEDRKALALAVLRPHDGNPVNSVTFLTAPHRPDHIVLITAGPLNREVKMWTSAGEEGWLLPSDAESWKLTQTLDIVSSAEPKNEETFFNQVVALPRAGLFLLANAKKNAIYAVHIEYGPNPAATRMDYIAEFTVTMPILSLTGTSDGLPDGDHVVQIYCVQTQAIQQYALDFSQCLPPPIDNVELEKTKSAASFPFDVPDGSATSESISKPSEMPVGDASPVPHISSGSAPLASHPVSTTTSEATSLSEVAVSGTDTEPISLASHSGAEKRYPPSPPLPLSPRLSRNLSGLRSSTKSYETSLHPNDHGGDQPVPDHSFNHRMDLVKDNIADTPPYGDNLREGDKDVMANDISMVANPATTFKHPTHLVTPSEILSRTASSPEHSLTSQGMNVLEAKVQYGAVNNDAESNEVEVKVIGETGASTNAGDIQRESQVLPEKKEKAFYSQASNLNFQVARDCVEAYNSVEGILPASKIGTHDPQEKLPKSGGEEVKDMTKDIPSKPGGSEAPVTLTPVQAAKGKRQKGKNVQVSAPVSHSSSPHNSADSSNGLDGNSGIPLTEAAIPQLATMQDMLDQLISTQKELQKQMNVLVSVPVTKEGKRLEGSLGRSMEKIVKANSDALWAHLQEENAKQEKLERDRTQHLTNMITNYTNKDLPTMLEKTLKKEIAAIGPVVGRSITQIMERTISSAITESFQKGVGEKAVGQLEKSVSSKLEATLARHIQTQFQTSGKQALQDALRSSLEASIIPSFEMMCKNMFEQVDTTFQKGFSKYTSAAQQQLESTHSPMAAALRDAINSASTITRTLSGEIADGQRKLLAYAAAGANPKTAHPLVTQLSNGPLAGLHEMVEPPHDPIKELSRLIAERKYEEGFAGALHRNDVSLVSWLCSQVDLQGILSMVPLPLSQGVLLALLQQLACDVSNDTARKLSWMTEVAVAINPSDPIIAMHVRSIFEQVYQILNHHRNLPTTTASEGSSIRLLMHVINSVLMSCK
ncbi:hypothetical protein UlMin_018039 [Ulmus minor]